MQRLSVYLASSVFPPRNLEAGRALSAFLPVSEAGKKAVLTLPTGATVDLPIVKKGTRAVVEYSRTQEPGLYTLLPAGGTPINYILNVSRGESDLQKLTPDEIAAFAQRHGVSVVHSDAEYQAAGASAPLRPRSVEADPLAAARALLWRADPATALCRRAEESVPGRRTVRTTLQFAGDWPWWAGIGGALALAAAAFALYRADVRSGAGALRWVLPGLRALAIGHDRSDAQRPGAAPSPDHRPAFAAAALRRYLALDGAHRRLDGSRPQAAHPAGDGAAARRRREDGSARSAGEALSEAQSLARKAPAFH